MASSVIGGDPLKNYAVTVNGITIQGTTKQYSTYYEMVADPNPPKYAIVLDASGDPSVDAGRANYEYTNGVWIKTFEAEAMDREMDHTHANIDALDKFRITEDGTVLCDGEEIVTKSVLDEAIESIHAGDLSENIGRLTNKLKYSFIKHEGTVDLQDQIYIVRGVKFTGRLPDGQTMPEDVAIRLIVDEAAAPLGGALICASTHDTINDVSTFRVNAAMDVMIIYDRAAKNWVTIGTLY